jgi:transposase
VSELPALCAQVAALVLQVADLQARLAKDGHNSGKLPASDGFARKTKSLRRKSGRKPGGELGHRGATLRLVATPDRVRGHRPSVCQVCCVPLPSDAPVVLRERRQVYEVPPLRLVVHERHALHLRCPTC